MQQQMNTTSPALDFLNNVLRDASNFGNEIEALGRDVNSDLVDYARTMESNQAETSQTIRDNLRLGGARRVGGDVGAWLSDPFNLVSALALLALIIWGLGKK